MYPFVQVQTPSMTSSKYNTYCQQFHELLIYFLLLSHGYYVAHLMPTKGNKNICIYSSTCIYTFTELLERKYFSFLIIFKLVTWYVLSSLDGIPRYLSEKAEAVTQENRNLRIN